MAQGVSADDPGAYDTTDQIRKLLEDIASVQTRLEAAAEGTPSRESPRRASVPRTGVSVVTAVRAFEARREST